jgi:hypothetical protein
VSTQLLSEQVVLSRAVHTQYTKQTGDSQDAGSDQECLFAQFLVRHSLNKSMVIVWLRWAPFGSTGCMEMWDDSICTRSAPLPAPTRPRPAGQSHVSSPTTWHTQLLPLLSSHPVPLKGLSQDVYCCFLQVQVQGLLNLCNSLQPLWPPDKWTAPYLWFPGCSTYTSRA